jgi:succinyl-CoA:acetate CoA-transferase
VRIAEQILDFVRHEIKKDRLPPSLPWQSGVGDVANAVLSGFLDDDFYKVPGNILRSASGHRPGSD